MNDDAGKLIAEFKKNASDYVRVSLSTFKGYRFIDLRVYTTTDAGELVATKKGITVAPDLWDDFRAAVAAAEQELEAAGLWSPVDGASPMQPDKPQEPHGGPVQ